MERKEYAALGETLCHEVLPNGLHIYVLPRPDYGKQFAFFATRYGGMDMRFRGEDGHWVDTPAGVAHFLEHKMFDTEDGDALLMLGANGADGNAFTTHAMTGYLFEGTCRFEENLRTLLSFVSVPYFTRASVDKEQGIIAQEIRMCEDDPGSVVYYQLLRCMYASHPVRFDEAGTIESIAEITPEMLYLCHGAFYRPGNMVLCVAGNVDPQRVVEIAREILPAGHTSAAIVDLGAPEAPEVAEHYAECRMEVSVPLFKIGFKGTPAAEGAGLHQRLVAKLACDVLFGPSAPLYSRLYGEGLINGTFGGYYESVPGCAYLEAGGESRDPQKVLEEVLAEAARLTAEGVDPALWERLKRAAYGSMVNRLNSLEDSCIELADAHFAGEDYLKFPELFQSIEWADAEALLRQWCTRERAALSVIRPVDEV